MSDSNTSIGCGTHSLWPLLFIVFKFTGGPIAAWSWWWVLLAPVPLVVEMFKAFAK